MMNIERIMRIRVRLCVSALLAMLPVWSGAAVTGAVLDDAGKQVLKTQMSIVLGKIKGPYTPNYCVCSDGSKNPVQRKDGSIGNPCGKTRFCAAFRAPAAEKIADYGMYIGNIYSSDLHNWDSIPDHANLVRGYILEKYFVDTHPEHKLAQMRAYGGLMGAEYEARDMLLFFERFLGDPGYNDFQHYLLAYELQKRYFVRNDQGAIQKVRAMASNIQKTDKNFKPLRDATHNQVSASLIPRLESYRDSLAGSRASEKKAISALVSEIRKLTSLDQSALKPEIEKLVGADLRQRLSAMLPGADTAAVATIESLAELMVVARQAIAAGTSTPADSRRLIDLNVTAAAVIQSRGSRLLDSGEPLTVEASVRLLKALNDAAYGSGLLSAPERVAAAAIAERLLATPEWDKVAFLDQLKKLQRVVEWAHSSALSSFVEVWAPWTWLLPDVAHIPDDIIRGSPLLLTGTVAGLLDDYVTGQARIRHHLFGREIDTGLRALNPGLARGVLRVAPQGGEYHRDEIVALKETPADLEPAAGIMTRGEGNVVSHVQLLARALGIPNAVVSNALFETIRPFDGREVFLVASPRGKVYLKEATAMNEQDRTAYAEYNRNARRSGDGSLSASSQKLKVDPEKLDIQTRMPIDLKQMRRADSGVRSGPKAAFLGELKSMFPENVADGIVIPFGAYYAHVQQAVVSVPEGLRTRGIAEPGEPLSQFQKQTYDRFFGEMVAAGTSEKALAEWIRPRLEVMRYSIQQTPLAADLKAAIRSGLEQNGLLRKDDPSRTTGCFVRSDTNVEDQDNFNGAGLNLTLFNMDSVDDIYSGLKKVWASPFTYRSFSWRQTLIDQPMWVLPSVIVLESIPSEKSGVLVTADIDSGDPEKMVVATSEGVGGAVDGTPTETLLWSQQGVELQTTFKSPWRRMLKSGGGSEIVASTGRDHVLEKPELKALIASAAKIKTELEPAVDPTGKPRPWDIEFGFSGGKLWLFQVRPFVGNEDLKNIPALAFLDAGHEQIQGTLSLKEAIR